MSLQIRTARAAKQTMPAQLKALGKVVIPTLQRAQVHSPFAGRVVPGEEIPQQGASVTEGQVIARIEQSSDISSTVALSAEIARSESALQQDREELSLAKKEVERVKKLGDAVSGRRRQESATALAVLQRRVTGLEQTLEQLRAGQRSGGNSPRVIELVSPISGVIAMADIAPGEFIEPAKTLFEILDPSFMWIEADIYELDLAKVQDAKRAVVLTDAFPEKRFEGSLVFLGSTVSRESLTVKATFGVENTEGLLRDGMAVDVFIESRQMQTGIMLPKEAIVNDGGRALVYVKQSPEIFSARLVNALGQWGAEVMVEEGIDDGAIVAIQGLYQIRMSGAMSEEPKVPVAEDMEKPTVSGEDAEDQNHEEK